MSNIIKGLSEEKKNAIIKSLCGNLTMSREEYRIEHGLETANGCYLFRWDRAFKSLIVSLKDLGMICIVIKRGGLWECVTAYDEATSTLYFWTKHDNYIELMNQYQRKYITHYIYNMAYLNKEYGIALGSPYAFNNEIMETDIEHKENELSKIIHKLPEKPENFVLVTVETNGSVVTKINAILPDQYLKPLDEEIWDVPVDYNNVHTTEEQIDDLDYGDILEFVDEDSVDDPGLGEKVTVQKEASSKVK